MKRNFVCQRVALVLLLLGLGRSIGSAAELDLQAISTLHLNEATAYDMFLDADHQKPLELQKQPVFKWQNLTNQGGQLGAIYVWTRDGRPEVLGSVFSQAEGGKRVVVHEFHTLAESVLSVNSPKDTLRSWKPTGTLSIKPVQGAPVVANSPAQRMFQMRAIARDFSAYSQSGEERIELRLAPQPMIRYQPTRTDVQDGAIFAYLSSAAGTDPEVVLQIEARKPDPKATDWTWYVGIIRFSDRDLVVMNKDVELFSSLANPKLRAKIEDNYRWTHNADETYSVFRAKEIEELSKPANSQ